MKFDSMQERTGVNKYQHYQFGCATCPICKSDVTTWCRDMYECHSCSAKWHYNNKKQPKAA